QDGGGEVLPELVHAHTGRLTIRIDAGGAQGGEVVVAVLHRDVVERRRPGAVGGGDQRVQGERGRSVASREPIDDLLQIVRRGRGHGLFPGTAPAGAPGVVAGAGAEGAGAAG